MKKSNYAYKGRTINLRLDEKDSSHVWEVVEYPHSVAIIAVTENNDIILEKQFRHIPEQTLWEIPAGKIDDGETPEAAAHRELIEETGYRASKLQLLHSGYVSPGYTTEYMHFFLATDLVPGQQQCEDDEQIEIELLPIKQVFNLIKPNQIKDNKTLLGLLLYQNMLKL